MKSHDPATSAMWAPIMHTTQPPAHVPAPVYVAEPTRAELLATVASKALRLCGHGKMRTWSDGQRMTATARFADYFWTECSCCWWFRGVAVGMLAGSIITAAIAAII